MSLTLLVSQQIPPSPSISTFAFFHALHILTTTTQSQSVIFSSLNLNMAPKSKYRMTYCQCISRRCGEVNYVDADGQLKKGNKISTRLARTHRIEDERHRLTSAASTDLDEIQRPPTSNLGSDSSMEPIDTLIERLRLSSTRNSAGNSRSMHQTPFSPQASTSAIPFRPAPVPSQPRSSLPIFHTSTEEQPVPETDQSNTHLPIFDTSSYMENRLETANPVLIFPLLITAILVVFENISLFTANWLLNVLQGFVTLVKTYGIGHQNEATEPVTFLEQLILDEIPRDIRTVFSNFQLEPDLINFNSCPACFALYHPDHTPKECTHPLNEIPGLFQPGQPPEVPHSDEPEPTCSEPLFKDYRDTKVPIRQYAVQNLHTWISRLVSRHNIEDALDESLVESRKPFNSNEEIGDIHQSYEWKNFQDDDGSQFTAHSGNLTFGMFTDGINPFGNKTSGHKASITFIVLVCLTLPIHLRYLPENLFLAGVAPGPKEPSLEQSNHILSPVVTQLQALWNEGIFLNQTPSHPNGRRIRAALLVVIADLPALRGALGFASHAATNLCSFCFLTHKDITNFNPESWRRRTSSHHQELAFRCRDADDPKKRKDIFKKYGVRYSVLNELSYFKVVDSQVVDSMHNLLLGLLQRHCRHFWSMSDQEDCDPAPPAANVREVRDLLGDMARKAKELFIPRTEDTSHSREDQFQHMEFGTNTSSNDLDFELHGWEGKWVEPSDPEEIVFDQAMLKTINAFLPRIHVPSWINRPIRSLGNASFGKLKADEWRNLFTIQLPLHLIPMWSNGDQRDQSLLKNLAHLASLVNLGLKRTMTSDRINRYRHHLKQYLEGVLILFPHSDLVTNHHMAFHLADCLERFGPVRAWWSFPFERLMGGILKTGHNNHIGQLEITFTKSFGRLGNLAALLKDQRVPALLQPYLTRLLSIIEPIPFVAHTASSLPSDQAIEAKIYRQLIKHMNSQSLDNSAWISAADWTFMSLEEKRVCAPVRASAKFISTVKHKEVTFSTFSHSKNDSVVQVNSGINSTMSFGRIVSIFIHRRLPAGLKKPIDDTWVVIQHFLPVPPSKPNCFLALNEPDLQAHLRLNMFSEPSIHHINHIVSHCAWVEYRAREITHQLDMPTVGLVSVDR